MSADPTDPCNADLFSKHVNATVLEGAHSALGARHDSPFYKTRKFLDENQLVDSTVFQQLDEIGVNICQLRNLIQMNLRDDYDLQLLKIEIWTALNKVIDFLAQVNSGDGSHAPLMDVWVDALHSLNKQVNDLMPRKIHRMAAGKLAGDVDDGQKSSASSSAGLRLFRKAYLFKSTLARKPIRTSHESESVTLPPGSTVFSGGRDPDKRDIDGKESANPLYALR